MAGWMNGWLTQSLPQFGDVSKPLQFTKKMETENWGGSGSEDCVGGVQRERQDRVWGMQDPHTDSDRTPQCPNGDCVQELTVQE